MILHKCISQRCKNDLFYCFDSGFVYSSCMLYFYFHALGIIMKLNGYLYNKIPINWYFIVQEKSFNLQKTKLY